MTIPDTNAFNPGLALGPMGIDGSRALQHDVPNLQAEVRRLTAAITKASDEQAKDFIMISRHLGVIANALDKMNVRAEWAAFEASKAKACPP